MTSAANATGIMVIDLKNSIVMKIGGKACSRDKVKSEADRIRH